MLFRCEVVAVTEKILTLVCWEEWQHSATTPADTCKYFRMQKIDITPSVEMLRACFETRQVMNIRFKGGILVKIVPTIDGAWNLYRHKNDMQTSCVMIDAKPRPEGGLQILTDSPEPLVREMAGAMIPYHENDRSAGEYLAHLMTLYGGRVADITSVERE